MKQIHFNNLNKKNYWILLLILSLICIVIGAFKPFETLNNTTYKYISICGFLLQVLYFSKLFWHKNTVQWNNKGIVIRIESFFGKSLRFDEIQETTLNKNTLVLTKIDSNKVEIDLSKIEAKDAKKLNAILIKYTTQNNL